MEELAGLVGPSFSGSFVEIVSVVVVVGVYRLVGYRLHPLPNLMTLND